LNELSTPAVDNVEEKQKFIFGDGVLSTRSNLSVQESCSQIIPYHTMPINSIRGLKNLGNTCYMNAVLQCLVRVPKFSEFFQVENLPELVVPSNSYSHNGQLALEFKTTVLELHAMHSNPFNPKILRSIIASKHTDFGTYSQQDAHDFLINFLDGLHEDLNTARKNNKKYTFPEPPDEEFNAHSKLGHREAAKLSWERHKLQNTSRIVDIFQGQFGTITSGIETATARRNFEAFMCISVPVSNEKSSVQECYDKFQSEEIVSDWFDPINKISTKANQQIVVFKAPKVLIIHLKRFKMDNFGMISEKLHTEISLSKNLIIRDASNNVKTYELISFVDHSGKSLNSGHYISHCCHPNTRSMWHKFDDDCVTKVEGSKLDKIFKSRTAYILFYTVLPAVTCKN